MLQGFWKALGEEYAITFGRLLTLCDEFSVQLDYATPVSGGEWVVTLAHFGDRTQFRFPRLDFSAREANNILSQRLIKAEKKKRELELQAEEAKRPLPEPILKGEDISKKFEDKSISADSDNAKDDSVAESPDKGGAVDTIGGSPDSAEGKLESSDSTLVVVGSPSEAGTKTGNSTDVKSSAKDAVADSTPKPEASSQSASDTKSKGGKK